MKRSADARTAVGSRKYKIVTALLALDEDFSFCRKQSLKAANKDRKYSRYVGFQLSFQPLEAL